MNSPESYSVVFLRKDSEHVILDFSDFENAYMKWAQYRDDWAKCLHEKKPLQIVEKDLGIVTVFDPGFLYEIIIKKRNIKTSPTNPYYKEMEEKGFTNSLKNYSNSSDLLDRGYKI